MFRWVHPWYLLALVCPVLLAWWSLRRRRDPYLIYPFTGVMQPLSKRQNNLWLTVSSLLTYLALALMILGLARPQWGRAETQSESEGIDIILALDASGSMAALDFRLDGEPVNRLTVVKKVVQDFIQRQSGDRLGMVIFGEQAYTQCPLTTDYDVLTQLLDHVHIGIAGDGTAIGDGLALSVKRLKDLPGKSKVIILLTDGRNNSGKISPEKAAELAKSFGIKVYTIGIGTHGPVPFPQKGIFGSRIVSVELEMDEKPLQEIAQITGGKYFFAADTKTLSSIYQEIGRLEKTKVQVKHYQTYEELYIYFAAAALLLLFIQFFLASTYLRRLE